MGFGVGFQEMVIIGLLFLVLFGPSKLPQMARDLGRFVNEARRSIDEFKEELTAEHEEDDKAKLDESEEEFTAEDDEEDEGKR